MMAENENENTTPEAGPDVTFTPSPEGAKFAVGDLIRAPGRSGGYDIGKVSFLYPDRKTAQAEYKRGSFEELLRRRGSCFSDPDQVHYLCETANRTKAEFGVAEEDATPHHARS